MKNLIQCSFLIILMSCGEDDSAFTETERLLTRDRWKLAFITEMIYLESGFDRADTLNLINDAQRDVLTFYQNQKVDFIYRYLDTTLQGNWQLSKDEVFLTTDLALDLSPATGYAGQHFYPYSKIALLTEEKLLLQTDTSYWYFTYEEEGATKSIPYSAIRVSHFTH